MIITITATMTSEDDTWAFNELAKWCFKRLAKMQAVQNGRTVVITIEGNEEILQPLIDYLNERLMGVI